MRTVVYQSYRTTNVPRWIGACMQTVRSWAQMQGHEYQFVDDRLLERAPPWFRDKAAGEICPVTDLARLVVAREYFEQGYDRTIWVDADIVVFAPERFVVDVEHDFAFCHEVWVDPNAAGEVVPVQKVNNSVTIFTRDSLHLGFCIDACLRIARARPRLGKLDVGTRFLTQLYTAMPYRLLANVGMFSPAIMADIAAGTERCLPLYARQLQSPLDCANLCGSFDGEDRAGVTVDERLYEAVIARSLQTRGEVVNRYVAARRPPAGGS